VASAASSKTAQQSVMLKLNYFAYNFILIHRTLRVTPAMAAGVTDRRWVADVVNLSVEAETGKQAV
jgi:hypothetical protein